MRKAVFMEGKIRTEIEKQRTVLEKNIANGIKETLKRDKLEAILSPIREDLNRRADEAAILIR